MKKKNTKFEVLGYVQYSSTITYKAHEIYVDMVFGYSARLNIQIPYNEYLPITGIHVSNIARYPNTLNLVHPF